MSLKKKTRTYLPVGVEQGIESGPKTHIRAIYSGPSLWRAASSPQSRAPPKDGDAILQLLAHTGLADISLRGRL
jgi:hypothetical protein